MSSFKRRVNENLWVIGDQHEDGSWHIEVVDAQAQPITNARKRARAIMTALRDESKLRAALWAALPPDAKAAMRGGQT